jgi:hypothetical protein
MHDFWKRINFGFRCLFSILLHGEIPRDVAQELLKPPARIVAFPGGAGSRASIKEQEEEKPATESLDRAVQMLALFQRDGRLIDFLSEDVAAYPDEQLGAAVRSIHENCRQVLERYVTLEPVAGSAEDQPFIVETGFDPASIKLIGNVKGEPPIKGVLRHRGWRVKELRLPSLPPDTGRMVVAPAEVEVA